MILGIPFGPFNLAFSQPRTFGEQWPFTVFEARLVCVDSEMLLETGAGTFGLTSQAKIPILSAWLLVIIVERSGARKLPSLVAPE